MANKDLCPTTSIVLLALGETLYVCVCVGVCTEQGTLEYCTGGRTIIVLLF